MRKDFFRLVSLVIVVGLAILTQSCGLVSKTAEVASKANPMPLVKKAASKANPLSWFGDDEDDAAAAEAEAAAQKPKILVPDSELLGTVHMVDRSNDFLLIRASRSSEITYGTSLISQNESGRQTAELKLSPERKGAFMVADIVKGDPELGDLVKVIGASEEGTRGLVPADEGEVQVLE